MKNIFFRLFSVVLTGVLLTACAIFEEPNPFGDNETPFTNIIFKINPNATDDFNYVGTGSPSIPNNSATTTTPFRATCNAKIYAKLTGVTSSVQVYRLAGTTSTTRELKTTLTPVNGVVFLDVLVSSLTLGGVAPTTGDVLLEFTAVSADGKTTTRRFTFTINNITGPAC